jgi:hypothetical protein
VNRLITTLFVELVRSRVEFVKVPKETFELPDLVVTDVRPDLKNRKVRPQFVFTLLVSPKPKPDSTRSCHPDINDIVPTNGSLPARTPIAIEHVDAS